LIYPNKQEEINLILNLKFDEIKNIINKKLEEFFKNYEEIQMHNAVNNNVNGTKSLNNSNNINNSNFISTPIPINQIFKKILLESNRTENISKNSTCNGSENTSTNNNTLLATTNKKSSNLGRSRVIIFSDMTNDTGFEYDQKLLFLMKRQNILIDCVSVGTTEIIVNNKI
jgi:hypothetical protein